MMSKDENGDVVIALVGGREASHKVKLGRVDWKSRSVVRNVRAPPRQTTKLADGPPGSLMSPIAA
jgi:hypothetical protein